MGFTKKRFLLILCVLAAAAALAAQRSFSVSFLGWNENVTLSPRTTLFVSNEALDEVFMMKENDKGKSMQRISTFGRAQTNAFLLSSPHGADYTSKTHELFVSNYGGHSVLVFLFDAEKKSLSLERVISGKLTGLNNPTDITLDKKNSEMYVLNSGAGNILVFDMGTRGDGAPKRIWNTDALSMGRPFSVFYDARSDSLYAGFYQSIVKTDRRFSSRQDMAVKDVLPAGMARDEKSGMLWVADFLHNAVAAYGEENGNLRLQKTLSGNRTQLNWPHDMVMDKKSGMMVVSNFGTSRVLSFALDADGNAPPQNVFSGSSLPRGLAFDEESGTLFVSRYGDDAVSVYNARGDSHEAVFVFDGKNKGIALHRPRGVFVDKETNEIFVAGYGSDAVFVYDFSGGAKGALKRKIAGNRTEIKGPEGVFVLDGKLYVANLLDNSVTVYEKEAKGNVAPVQKISGSKTGLSWPYGITVHGETKEIFVSNLKGNAVAVFPHDADGNVSPKRMISGNHTGLSAPLFIALDEKNKELFVANGMGDKITVYALDAEGDAMPVREIAGQNTLLHSPEGVALDAENNLVFVSSFETHEVLAFKRDARGNTRPALQLASGFSNPTGLFVIP